MLTPTLLVKLRTRCFKLEALLSSSRFTVVSVAVERNNLTARAGVTTVAVRFNDSTVVLGLDLSRINDLTQ